MPFSCKDPCDGLQGLDNPGSSPHLQILDLLTSSDANMLFTNRGTFRVSRNQDLISLASWGMEGALSSEEFTLTPQGNRESQQKP